MATTSKFLSCRSAAQILGVNDSRIRQLLRAEKLSGFKIGLREWIIDRKSVENLLKAKQKRKKKKLNKST